MTVEELTELVPEEHRSDLTTLLDEQRASGNPLAGVNETNVDKFVDGNPVLKSFRDRFLASGLETWQKNNIDKIYAERYAEEHPEETEDQKRIKALEISISESNARAMRADNTVVAQNELTERGLPKDLLEHVIGQDAESTMGNIEKLAAAFTAHGETVADAVRKDILQTYGRDPDVPVPQGGEKFLTEAQIEALSPDEQAEKWDLVMASIAHLEKQNR